MADGQGAAGIGITPLLSMAEALHSRGQSFSLHYYTRHAADVAFGERLRGHFAGAAVHFRHSSEGRSPREHLPGEQAGNRLMTVCCSRSRSARLVLDL